MLEGGARWHRHERGKAKTLNLKIAALESTSTEPIQLPTPATIRGWMENLQAFIDRDPLAAREYLRKLLKGGRVRLRAQEDGVYVAKTELLPLVLLTTTPPSGLPKEASLSSACCGGVIRGLDTGLVTLPVEVRLAA